MIFHYVDGALVCECKVYGLTHTLAEYNELSSAFLRYRDPEDEYQWWGFDPAHPPYGGYRYFVCESLSRRAAQMIVDALGGYLVPETIPPSRQLSDGGPFHVHQFSVRAPMRVSKHNDLERAIRAATVDAERLIRDGIIYRVYDNSGFMVAEFK